MIVSRVAVLHAAGKHFSAGVELDKWAPIFGSGSAFPVQADEIDPFGLTGERHNKPLIIAVQGVLKSTQCANVLEHDAAVQQMFENLVPVMKSEDAAEGVKSFIERRKAVYTGK